jgi:nucleoredoxin
MVANTACAIGEADSVSVVVVDEACLGCILQSQSFLTWLEVNDFVERLPSHRIVMLNGKAKETETDNPKKFGIPRLGGWKGRVEEILTNGVVFIGQVDAHPDWTFCSTLQDCPKEGYEIELERPTTTTTTTTTTIDISKMQLRTERLALPHRIAGRIPESAMPFQTQLMASEEQKRLAFTSFCTSNSNNGGSSRYCGYTTKPKAPIYLLDSTSYPFQRMDATTVDATSKENAWNTFHYLPSPLVPKEDLGIVTAAAAASDAPPKFEIPLEVNFFNHSLGSQLLNNNNTPLPTSEVLHNARLIGLYFSAHWCGPCRSFTPMLAEMYEHLKDVRPTHGLEIVFVSGDRDANSFQQYFSSMPWQAIPFDHLRHVKQSLNRTYVNGCCSMPC